MWAPDALDLVQPAQLRLEANGLGTLAFIAISADVDYRVGTRNGADSVEFTWRGHEEGDDIAGRGWAILEDDRLRGHLFIHHGDESSFRAVRSGVSPQRNRRRTLRVKGRARM